MFPDWMRRTSQPPPRVEAARPEPVPWTMPPSMRPLRMRREMTRSGRDDEAAVDFVDPVLVVEEGVEAAVLCGEGGGGAGLVAVEVPGDEGAEERDENGDDGVDALHEEVRADWRRCRGRR